MIIKIPCFKNIYNNSQVLLLCRLWPCVGSEGVLVYLPHGLNLSRTYRYSIQSMWSNWGTTLNLLHGLKPNLLPTRIRSWHPGCTPYTSIANLTWRRTNWKIGRYSLGHHCRQPWYTPTGNYFTNNLVLRNRTQAAIEFLSNSVTSEESPNSQIDLYITL